jgi:hypothetical protein
VITGVKPGDLLCVRSPGLAGKLIRIGEEMASQPGLANHVAIVHHLDAHGTCWTLEGRPGGVGWRQADDYLKSPYTVTNIGQPKTLTQRSAVCKTAEAMIGTAYSWEAIAADAGMAFGLKDIWAEKVNGTLPGGIVCSSLAAYAYDRNSLAAPNPADYAHVTPADWVALIMEHGWDRLPGS